MELKKLAGKLVALLGSFGLATTLLLLLLVLTYLGTIEQVQHGLYEVQKKYFESTFLIHWAFGAVPIPLPGAYLVLAILGVNLIVGGMIRLRLRWGVAGVLICHIGILVMLIAGFVKQEFSDDGHLTLVEGRSGSQFTSYHEWELSIAQVRGMASSERPVTEHLIDGVGFVDAGDGNVRTFTSAELPFDVRVTRFLPNCVALPKGPMFEVDVPIVDGYFLQARDRLPENERNLAGAYIELVERDGGTKHEGILWAGERFPYSVTVGNERFTLALDRKRFDLPFTVTLDKFNRALHPGTTMAKAYSSKITKTEDGNSQQILISMNEPLRHKGFTLFQSSFSPPDAGSSGRYYSTFSVVRNPSDQWPLYSCILIAIGLLVHFGTKLVRYLKIEAVKRS